MLSLSDCMRMRSTAALLGWHPSRAELAVDSLDTSLHRAAFRVQEVTPFSLPDLMHRAAELLGEHKLIIYLLFPWIPTMQALVGKQLRLYSWRALSALSEDVRRHALRVANQWGVGHFVHDTLLRVRPCAVKVLPCDSFHGAYGPRSAENEVRAYPHGRVSMWHFGQVIPAHGVFALYRRNARRC